ncbi:hypothetical protein BH23ACT5_BH23ACT5_24070 [soil metagenome]
MLDDHFTELWGDANARQRRRYHGIANYRLVRYADDFVRHEALCDRVEMKGLHRWSVAAGRQKLGAA